TRRYVANGPHCWGDVNRANRIAQCGRNRPTGWNVKWPAIRAWGRYHSRVYWIDGRRIRAAAKAHSGKGRAVPERPPVDRSFFVAFLCMYLSMASSTGGARRAVLVTALCAGASLARAQQLPRIESLSESFGVCAERLCAATR